MQPEFVPFADRHDAGRRLASLLGKYRHERPYVLALPRGGVALGYEIARALDAPLDVMIARKVGAPMQPEFGIGAVAPGVTLVDRESARMVGVTEDDFERLADQERDEVRRRLRHYRGTDEVPELNGRTAILVDDGLATGVTAVAAARSLRALEPRRVVLAVGVCPLQTAQRLQDEVDEVVCVGQPEPFVAVGRWYVDFEQVSDSEVMDLLERAGERTST